MRLLIDDREHAVVPSLRALLDSNTHEVTRLERSDYAIVGDTNDIFALFERKTLPDYGSSIADGRTKNKHKMLEVRELTGCHIYYIIEGPLRPAPTTMYGGRPYSSILSSIRHLQTEFGIMIVRTADAEDTARELVELMGSYAVRPPQKRVIGASESPDLNSRYEIDLQRPIAGRSDEAALLFMRAQKSRADKRVTLWSHLTGIGPKTALSLAQVSPLKVLQGEVNARLSRDQQEIVRKLLAASWNIEQQQFLTGIDGVGKTRSIAIMGYGTCLKDLWFKGRERMPADLRRRFTEAMEDEGV